MVIRIKISQRTRTGNSNSGPEGDIILPNKNSWIFDAFSIWFSILIFCTPRNGTEFTRYKSRDKNKWDKNTTWLDFFVSSIDSHSFLTYIVSFFSHISALLHTDFRKKGISLFFHLLSIAAKHEIVAFFGNTIRTRIYRICHWPRSAAKKLLNYENCLNFS